nr:translation initiation factor IF-2 [Oryctolagus cuniculus]
MAGRGQGGGSRRQERVGRAEACRGRRPSPQARASAAAMPCAPPAPDPSAGEEVVPPPSGKGSARGPGSLRAVRRRRLCEGAGGGGGGPAGGWPRAGHCCPLREPRPRRGAAGQRAGRGHPPRGRLDRDASRPVIGGPGCAPSARAGPLAGAGGRTRLETEAPPHPRARGLSPGAAAEAERRGVDAGREKAFGRPRARRSGAEGAARSWRPSGARGSAAGKGTWAGGQRRQPPLRSGKPASGGWGSVCLGIAWGPGTDSGLARAQLRRLTWPPGAPRGEPHECPRGVQRTCTVSARCPRRRRRRAHPWSGASVCQSLAGGLLSHFPSRSYLSSEVCVYLVQL